MYTHSSRTLSPNLRGGFRRSEDCFRFSRLDYPGLGRSNWVRVTLPILPAISVALFSPLTSSECTSLLQGHTSLVGQLQLSGNILVTGGSDGRVIAFNLATNTCIHRLCAHDNSVTCLQFDERFIISGGNDGRIKLWDARTGVFLRELSRAGDAVWRVAYRDDQCAVLLQRGGKTILEVISFKPA